MPPSDGRRRLRERRPSRRAVAERVPRPSPERLHGSARLQLRALAHRRFPRSATAKVETRERDVDVPLKGPDASLDVSALPVTDPAREPFDEIERPPHDRKLHAAIIERA